MADIFHIDAGVSKFSYRSGEHTKWRNQVDAIRLEEITPERIDGWRRKYIKARESNPADYGSAVRSANSYLRCARALFSKKWLARLRLRIPSPLPFEAVRVEKRFRSVDEHVPCHERTWAL